MTFITNLINGVSLGSIYAVIALGYTMVYGIAKMLNFAHGDVIMVGAYIVFALTSYAGVNPYLALVISMAACTLLGMAIERFAYKPLRGASPLAVLITAIGVSYFLQNMALLIFGSQAKSFTSIVNLPALTLAGGKITISAETIVTIIVSLIIMVSLTLFVNKTKPGRAMLAVSEDKGAAQLMGVNVNATISLTFAIGSGLAAVAGVLLCSAYPTLSSQTGAMPGIKAFVAAVLVAAVSSFQSLVLNEGESVVNLVPIEEVDAELFLYGFLVYGHDEELPLAVVVLEHGEASRPLIGDELAIETLKIERQ